MAGQSSEPLSTDLDLKQSSVDTFFKDLDDKHLTFKLDAEELEDVQLAVHEAVLQIIERVQDLDDRFVSHGVIPVGSFKEGTKILEPNEFDYLVVIDELSKPGVVKPLRVCKQRRGYMHLQVLDKSTQERWADYIENGELFGFVLSSPYCRLNSATSNAVGFTTLIMQVYREQGSANKITVTKPTGTLKFSGVTMFREPNTAINLTWCTKHGNNPLQITADLSPAIRCYNTDVAITPADCPNQIFYNDVQQHGSYLLTPGRGHKSLPTKCFRISITEVEVNLVRSLGITHKTCYRVLKYILANLCCKLTYAEAKYDGFSSYILKSAVIHHSAKGSCQSSNIHECIKQVVMSLLNCLMQEKPYLPNMPSLFIQDHNLFQDLISYQSIKHGAMNLIMHVQSLKTFLFFTEELQVVPQEDYNYENTLKKLDTFIVDLKRAFNNAENIGKNFLDTDRSWKTPDISTTDLLNIFGVPYELLK